MDERNLICCDAKGDVVTTFQGKVVFCGVRGKGKSYKQKLQTIQLLKEAGYDVKEIKLDKKTGSFNPFDIDFAETTLEEKEQKLRNLLEAIEYDQHFIMHYLQDMSFLDDKPEWKERATEVLKEYVLG